MVKLTTLCFICLMSVSFLSQASRVDEYINKYDMQLFYPEAVSMLYPNSQRQWNSDKAQKDLENQLALLILADLNGTLENRYYQLQQAIGLEYDILATDTLIYLLTYQSLISKKGTSWFFGGRLESHLGEPSPQIITQLHQAFENKELENITQTLPPNSSQYAALYEQLLSYYDPYHVPVDKMPFSRVIKPNEVLSNQNLLLRLQVSGELNQEDVERLSQDISGIYHSELVDIVKQFQTRHGLASDGIIGPKTIFWLNMSAQERVRIMALNIQRLRLWQDKKNRFVLVNIPSYEMGYWQEDKLLFHSKVIVGKPARKTPLLSSRLDSIVFNPNWKVPTRIMKEDILPKAFNNQDYLLTHNYEVIPTWRSNDVIPLNEIEWDTMTVDNFPYKLRQKSGNSNALGRYKFNIPNRNAIYLHDTPSRSLFKKQHRAYSSGCIRVERASEFAQLLMKESQFSVQDYKNYHQLPKTNTVGLGKRILVYTIYQTAWVDDKNQIQFRNDIYKYDKWSKSRN